LESLGTVALVLGGGNALGAYHGGAFTAIAAEDVRVDWIVGSSIGAITAALIAGSAPERRVATLQEFWHRAASTSGEASWVPKEWRQPLQVASALQARLFGRPALFHPRLLESSWAKDQPGLYDVTPFRNTLIEMVDFDRLNDGPTRVCVVAVDVETGEEVVFDTRNERIGVEHLLASAALIPDFQPVTINGRVLVDGGLADNVPVDVVLSEPPDLPLTCFALDLFPTHALPPAHLLQAAQRQSDLMFANQTRRSLRDQREIWRLRRPGHPASVHWLEYRGTSDEIAMKSYDFSGAILKRRWHIGEQDMRAALRVWRETPARSSGLMVYPPMQHPDAFEASDDVARQSG